MKLRERLMILMMIIALPPLIFISVVDHVFLRELGGELASRTHRNLIRDAQVELTQLVDSYANIIERELGIISLLLWTQTSEIQRKLNTEDIENLEAQARSDNETLSNIESPLSTSGMLEDKIVYLPPDVDHIEITKQYHKLKGLSDVFGSLYQTEGDIVLWNYVSFKSGLHMVYPKGGDFPEDYDSRTRGWFTQTIEQAEQNTDQYSTHTRILDQVHWFPLVVDSLTGTVTMTVTLPVFDKDKNVIGVSGIDIRLTKMLSAGRLPAQWKNSRLLLVALANKETLSIPYTDTSSPPVPVVFADTNLQDERHDYRVGIDLHPLEIENTKLRMQLIEDLLKQKPGILNIQQDEKQAVWGYAPLGPRASLLVIVPYDEINARADAIEKIALDKTWQLMRISTVILIGVVIMVIVLAWSRSRTVTQPILHMARAAERIAGGDLRARVRLKNRQDEIGLLADTFNSMIPKLKDQMRLSESISVAQEVQQSLLPSSAPSLPGVDLAGRSIYCDETGGDYYDFIQFDELGPNAVAVTVGDVVGHGISAALLMATARALLRSRAALGGPLRDVLADINFHLCDSRFLGRFMTLFYLQINVVESTNNFKLQWISAGHDPAIVYDIQKRSFSELAGTDIPLGVLHHWKYHEAASQNIEKNHVIVLGTDGIWECRNKQREFYGKENLQSVIQQNAHRTADEIAEGILDSVKRFRADVPQEDDITLVVIKI
ncbi:SpoIIE family protein phosphatase [Poriferisphaera sp. WC338]|uniref:SpoIIE family protein phosphatase n=1 Tax=Poriferisphaera sp. WC338 TaxID=3425129 RepID=UPI003D8187ED